jgi:uncharacterized repeat protein (TIGR03803 family)
MNGIGDTRRLGTFEFIVRRAGILAVALASLLATAQGQSYQILYDFGYGNGPGGAEPWGQPAIDAAGNLYFATDIGLVDKLSYASGNWSIYPLHSFGYFAAPQIMRAPNGVIYGATAEGGSNGYGSVFELRPSPTVPPTPLTLWRETTLYSFQGCSSGSDGCEPTAPPIADSAGNLYGTTGFGGANGVGVVYELVRAGQDYTEQALYNFSESGSGGCEPVAGLAADSSFTNLYGVTTSCGPSGYGTVFKLTNTGSGWTESTLYAFQGGADGWDPFTTLTLDAVGDLYGSTRIGGVNGGGTIFELTPSGGGYIFTVLYSLEGCDFCYGPENGSLTLDSAGSIYGTTFSEGAYSCGPYGGPPNCGSVFELTPSGGGYTYTDLHDFGSYDGDGAFPEGQLVRDASDNLYGTTTSGGNGDNGAIFEITP